MMLDPGHQPKESRASRIARGFGTRLASRIGAWHGWRRSASTARPPRANQNRTFEKTPGFLRAGKLRGIIKKPPAAGKTATFAGLIAACEESALVLIPSKSLRTDTVDTLHYEITEAQKRVGRGPAKKAPTVYVIEPGKGGQTTTEQLRQILQTHKSKSDKFVVVLTYQGMLSVANTEPALLDRLLDAIGVMVSDESHRSLGDQTKEELKKANREGFQDCVSACFQFLESANVSKSALGPVFDRPAGEEDTETILHRALRVIVEEVSKDRFPGVFGGARTTKLNRLARLLNEAIEGEPDDDAGGDEETSPSGNAQRTFASVDELHDYLFQKLERLAEGSIEEIIEGKQRPIFHLFVTATPELALKEVAKTYDAEILDSDTFMDIAEEGTIIIPRRIGVGDAVYRTDKKEAKTSIPEMAKLAAEGKFVMRDGRSVMQAVAEAYVKEWETNDHYLPGIGRCASIDEAESVTQYLCGLGIKAVRCTSANTRHAAGMEPDEAKRRLQLPKDDPDRIDVVVTVSQVGEGWDVPTLRCALFFSFVRNSWQVIQFVGRIMRQLAEGSPYPEKTLQNTCIIEPDWMVVSAKPREEGDGSGEGNSRFADGGSNQGSGKAKPRTPVGEVYRHPNSLSMLVSAKEVEASTAVARGLERGVRVPFDPEDLDQVRVLLGSISSLIANGAPINIRTTTFHNEQFDWHVSSARLIQALCPAAASAVDAARQLAILLWPDLARQRIFDSTNADHIRAILKSPRNAMRKGQISLSAFYQRHACQERGWDFGPRELSDRCFGDGHGGLTKLREMIIATWGAVQSKKQPSIANVQSWANLTGSAEALMTGDVYTKVFEYNDWKLSGWLLVERWAALLNYSDELVERRLARHFFPGSVPDDEKPSPGTAPVAPALPAEPQPIYGTFLAPHHDAPILEAENDFKSVLPPEREVSFTELLEHLRSHRCVPKPAYQFHPMEGKGSTARVCLCRVMDQELVVAGSDERTAKEWAAKLMIGIVHKKNFLTMPPLDLEHKMIQIDARTLSVSKTENRESLRYLRHIVGISGMRSPIGFLTDSKVVVGVNNSHSVLHTVVLLVGDYQIVASGPTPFIAIAAAARTANLRVDHNRRGEATLYTPGLEEFAGEQAETDHGERPEIVDTARLELKVRCSHDLRHPIVLLDERTRRTADGYDAEVRVGTVFGSGKGLTPHNALSRGATDFLTKIGGPYTDRPAMPDDSFAAQSKQPDLIRKAMANPRNALLRYCQERFCVHPKYVVAEYESTGKARCELRIPLVFDDLRLVGLVDECDVPLELDLLSINCLRMLVDHRAIRGRVLWKDEAK